MATTTTTRYTDIAFTFLFLFLLLYTATILWANYIFNYLLLATPPPPLPPLRRPNKRKSEKHQSRARADIHSLCNSIAGLIELRASDANAKEHLYGAVQITKIKS